MKSVEQRDLSRPVLHTMKAAKTFLCGLKARSEVLRAVLGVELGRRPAIGPQAALSSLPSAPKCGRVPAPLPILGLNSICFRVCAFDC